MALKIDKELMKKIEPINKVEEAKKDKERFRDRLPLLRSKNIFIRVFGYLLYTIVGFFAFLIVLAVIIALISPLEEDPESVIDRYQEYFNSMDTSSIYELLSEEAKKKYTEDHVHNIIYALKFYYFGLYSIQEYKVVSKKVYDSKAELELEITWNIMGFQVSRNHSLSLTLENGKWKLDHLIT